LLRVDFSGLVEVHIILLLFSFMLRYSVSRRPNRWYFSAFVPVVNTIFDVCVISGENDSVEALGGCGTN